MAKKILLIGGTYFLGRAFSELMLENGDSELTLIHRGTSAGVEGTKEILADRHDPEALKKIPHVHYDAIVDFCAYKKGDIENLLTNLNVDADQYVFISTSDVYKRGTGKLLTEDAELEDRDFGGEAGEYISGKAALEKEIAGACEKKGCRYTVLRPVFIFGEGNYAPREGIYFQWIDKAGQIIHPIDADGEFQLVYVKDVAKAIETVIANPECYDKAFNVCENEMIGYDQFADLLRSATETDFSLAEVDVNTINEKGIPLPFPLTKAETNYYDGSRLSNLGMRFTPLEKALRQTFLYWKKTQTV